jgi:hypothetical protein
MFSDKYSPASSQKKKSACACAANMRQFVSQTLQFGAKQLLMWIALDVEQVGRRKAHCSLIYRSAEIPTWQQLTELS